MGRGGGGPTCPHPRGAIRSHKWEFTTAKLHDAHAAGRFTRTGTTSALLRFCRLQPTAGNGLRDLSRLSRTRRRRGRRTEAGGTGAGCTGAFAPIAASYVMISAAHDQQRQSTDSTVVTRYVRMRASSVSSSPHVLSMYRRSGAHCIELTTYRPAALGSIQDMRAHDG